MYRRPATVPFNVNWLFKAVDKTQTNWPLPNGESEQPGSNAAC